MAKPLPLSDNLLAAVRYPKNLNYGKAFLTPCAFGARVRYPKNLNYGKAGEIIMKADERFATLKI